MLEKLEEIEEEGFADGVDMLEPSDVKSFHENLVKTLDYLVNQTLSILTRGSPVANTAPRNTMANKNRISQSQSRYSKRHRTPSGLLQRENTNRLTASQMQMLGIGGGTGSTINQLMNNSHNNITRNESNTSGGNLQSPID